MGTRTNPILRWSKKSVKQTHAQPSDSTPERAELQIGEVTLVYSSKKSCSGRNITPSEASDLLVQLLRD